VGLLALVAVPAGIVASRYSDQVTLIRSAYVCAPVGAVLGLYAIVLARRGRETVQRTLGRAGGDGAARVGRFLGTAGLCVAVTAGMALGFYGLLTLFAS
jgi:hypothetical protein